VGPLALNLIVLYQQERELLTHITMMALVSISSKKHARAAQKPKHSIFIRQNAVIKLSHHFVKLQERYVAVFNHESCYDQRKHATVRA